MRPSGHSLLRSQMQAAIKQVAADLGVAGSRLVGRDLEPRCFALARRPCGLVNQPFQRAVSCADARMWSPQLVSQPATQSRLRVSPGRGLGDAPVCVVAAS